MVESWRRPGSMYNPHPAHYDARRTIAFELGLTGRALRALLWGERWENGLREGRDVVLLEIARLEGERLVATPGRVRGSLSLSRAALSALLDRLARIGYVERRPLAEDRRTYRVVLTDEGRDAALVAAHVVRWADEVLARELSASDVDVLRELLSRARAAWLVEATRLPEAEEEPVG